MSKIKQKFAWLPTSVFDMRYMDYKYITIWLSWYWKDNRECEESKDNGYTALDGTKMYSRCKTKHLSNRW